MHYPEAVFSRFTLLLLAAAALTACDERASAGTPDAAPPPPAATATASAKPTSSGAAPTSSGAAPASAGELKVLKMVLTSEVKKKEPIDKLDAAAPGQRVWAHVTVRNRTEVTKPIALVFLVGGAERAKVDLKADPSWSYRTWGYVTLRPGDSGDLTAEVRDESGTVMERARIPIKGDGSGKPQKKAPARDE